MMQNTEHCFASFLGGGGGWYLAWLRPGKEELSYGSEVL